MSQRRLKINNVLQIISCVLTLTMSALLTVDLFWSEKGLQTERREEATTPTLLRPIQKSYGNDYDYMTLNHSLDFLWEDELRANNAIIVLPGQEDEPIPDLGSISMSVKIEKLELAPSQLTNL